VHRVAVLALPGTIAFDLATPIEVLGRAGAPGYRVVVAGAEPVVDAGPLQIVPGHGLEALDDADTIVLPGRSDPTAPIPAPVLERLHTAADRGCRLVSICVGAFTLAASGLLDGRRATTHWQAAELFRRTHPRVVLDPSVLYVDEGRFLTSAGAAAGVDLCLYLVGRDYGAAAAAAASRIAVSPLHRDGGQAQYVHRPTEPRASASLAPLLAWIEEHTHRDLTLAEIARHAGVSTRTLNRRFHDEIAATPIQWLTRTRIRQARELLETTDLEVEAVGRRVGLGSPSNFRSVFVRHSGVPPRHYRRNFRAP
jgi:transcriptional regulator GlxA family with amidase domain